MDEIKIVDLERIKVSPFQPRKSFVSQEIEELAESIQTVGLIHPPTVRALEDNFFELLSGERRLRASRLAGLREIPVYVRQAGHDQAAHAALIENIQRVDLNPLEIASALKRLQEEFHCTQEELSHKIGKKRSTVANYLRLLTLPEVIQKALKEERLTMGHAKAILSVEPLDQRMNLFEWIIRQSLSVRSAEEAARLLGSKPPPVRNESGKDESKIPHQGDLFIADLERGLSQKLSTRVSITENSGKGVLSLHFYSLDDLDRLLEYF